MKKRLLKWLFLHFNLNGYRNTKRFMSGIITFTTDWGIGDPYSALFKAHVWRVHPGAVFADISHDVHNGSRLHAAYLLSSACWAFPEETVHVVDVRELTSDQLRKVANRERPLPFLDFLAVRCREQFFLLENNGILSLIDPEFANLHEVVKLAAHADYNQYNTFNALNYYADAAARLSAGCRLSELGEPYPEQWLEKMVLPALTPTENSVGGRILHIDARGNLITDIREPLLLSVAQSRKKLTVQVGRMFERLKDFRLCKRYLSVAEGKGFAVVNASGYVELGQKNASLAATLYGSDDLRSGIGDSVTLMFE